MSTSSWDDMKRVREEEFFQREEREKLNQLREKLGAEKSYIQATREALNSYERGFSPLGGKPMFRVDVGNERILDCPEEGCLLMTYETLANLLAEGHKRDADALEAWDKFLGNAK